MGFLIDHLFVEMQYTGEVLNKYFSYVFTVENILMQGDQGMFMVIFCCVHITDEVVLEV